ncbi:4-hydroxybenzoate polyprenyltransferase [Streptomyces sp. LBL]|uniref:UbiA family prenyltransferase n=1 Tax=Streptomyces sp. LBL TaxID=2940562 RepID=UPI002474752D|nr:UbiA family prenyltransferase [Streptomyces sp. LBL]MDH6627249.1 4-hydroxybenzoate polyprenyltransferase [Streptomyces sp. LBL]
MRSLETSATAPITAEHRRRGPAPAVGLLLAAHPAPSAAVTAVVAALAAASGRSGAGTVLIAAAVLTGQLSVGWSNDLIDAARDVAATRLDKPLATGTVSARTVAIAAGCALAACVPLSLANGWQAGSAHLTGVAAAWGYNLGAKRTVWSWLPYAVAFGLLPAFVTLSLPDARWPHWWAWTGAALLGVGAHAANVLPDIDDDLAANIRGLPQRGGRRGARALAAAAPAAGSAVLILGPAGPVGIPARAGLAATCALSLTVALWPAGRSRAPFLICLGLAAADVALLLLRGARLM